MNTKNNKRRQQTREKIESCFVELLQDREIDQITVSDICKQVGVNRSTFYANYLDIYHLADTLRNRLEQEVNTLYLQEGLLMAGLDYLKLFHHIRENRLFYKTYFKLGYDRRHIVDLSLLGQTDLFPREHLPYHIAFHKAGLNAIINAWLDNGCRESPEEMAQIIKSEYRGRQL